MNGHDLTVVSTPARWLGVNETSTAGDVFNTENSDWKCVAGNDLARFGDDPSSASSESRLSAGNTLSMRDDIKRVVLMNADSTACGTRFATNGEQSFSVSSSAPKKRNSVDGGKPGHATAGDADTYVRNDTSVGNGRQLNSDLDSESTVIRLVAAARDRPSKTSGDVTVPIAETNADLGTQFNTPGDNDSSSFKNCARTTLLRNALRSTADIISRKFTAGCGRDENSRSVDAYVATRFTTTASGSRLVGEQL